jgi:hypothetical protein
MSQHVSEIEFQKYLDHQLTQIKEQQIDQHLSECKNCRQQLLNYQKIYDALRQEPEFELPADFARTIMARLAIDKKSPLTHFYFENLLAILGILAAAIFIFDLSGFNPILHIFSSISPYLNYFWGILEGTFRSIPNFFRSSYTLTGLAILTVITLFEHAFLRNRNTHFLFL